MNRLFLLVLSFLFLGVFACFLMAKTVFVLTSPPKVISFQVSPLRSEDGKVFLNSKIKISFDKPLLRKNLEIIISPEIYGEWKFENPLFGEHFFKTLSFVPAIDYLSGAKYEIKIKNIEGFGLNKKTSFSFNFETVPLPQEKALTKTEENSVKRSEIKLIKAPFFWQKYKLSCEAASLKMALASKKVYVSEDEIMERIGIDKSPRRYNVWGDPYKIYVGDVDGKICSTGFGVFWEPVAEAASYWRESEAFSDWTLNNLIKEISFGNPVVVWGAMPTGTLTDCSWVTKEGRYVKAFKETHVRTVVGFVGSMENPSKIILNDPYSGVLYWEKDFFLENWSVFDNSGVVIR